MDQQRSIRGIVSIIGMLIVATIVSGILLFSQSFSDLADPRLKANASLPQHNPPGAPIPQWLMSARALAPSKGVPWKGLDIVASDDESASPDISLTTILLQQYQKQACQADAVVVGHATSSAYHLSAFGTAVYGDYIFVVDNLLKDNPSFPIHSKAEIIVTRPGGSLLLPEGPVNFDMLAYPRFQSGVTYLQFLRYIPQSSAYRAIDPLSTLAADGDNWVITRKAFSRVAVPGFTRGALEATIMKWIVSCKS